MTTIVSKQDVIKALKTFCGKYDTYALAAAALKVTPAQLSQALRNKSNVIPERILRKLGFKIAMVYVRDGKSAKPGTEVKAKKPRKIARDSETGLTVTPEYAKANPLTTQVETVKPKPEFIDVTEKV